MTHRVHPSEQGRLQGAQSSLRGIAGLIGPGLFTLTFAHFIGAHADTQVPGTPFLLAAGLLAGAAAIAWRATRPNGPRAAAPRRSGKRGPGRDAAPGWRGGGEQV